MLGGEEDPGARPAGGASSGGEPRDPKEKTDFETLYGLGAIIGLSPRQVDELTEWELSAAVDGWRAANCPDAGPKPPTPDEHDALVAKYEG